MPVPAISVVGQSPLVLFVIEGGHHYLCRASLSMVLGAAGIVTRQTATYGVCDSPVAGPTVTVVWEAHVDASFAEYELHLPCTATVLPGAYS